MARFETQVSKTDPTIKKIIEATSGSDAVDWPGGSPKKWSGRNVSVVQVDPGFTYQLYNDTGEPKVYIVGSIGSRLTTFRVPRPSYGGPATQINAPDPSRGEVVVVREIGARGSITIYVPELDAGILDIARDALLAREAKRARSVLQQLGAYEGIGAALIRAQGKTLERASGPRPTSEKSARQLDREIAAFMRSRKGA